MKHHEIPQPFSSYFTPFVFFCQKNNSFQSKKGNLIVKKLVVYVFWCSCSNLYVHSETLAANVECKCLFIYKQISGRPEIFPVISFVSETDLANIPI